MEAISPEKPVPRIERQQLSESPHKEIDSRWVELKFSQNFTPRSYFASCIQAGNIYVHGGFNAEKGIMKDLLVCCMYDVPAAWKEVTPKNSKQCNPGPLRNHSLSSYKSNLILIGGQQNVIDNNSKIYRFDMLANTWSVCKCTDSKGKAFNFALDSHNAIVHKNDIYLIGGYDANQTFFSTKIIKISLQKITEDELNYQIIQSDVYPSERCNSACCLVDDEIYLFGGGKVDDVFSDLWIWNINKRVWTQCLKGSENFSWPDKRKGATMVFHKQSNNIFLFGGIKAVTKERNDVYVWMIEKKRWIKIHSNTNQLYDPSPTIKDQLQSPSVSNQKRRKQKMKTHGNFGSFKIGIHSVSQNDNHRMNETNFEFVKKDNNSRTEQAETVTDYKRKMTVVQQKKYRQFLNRKKRLLSSIQGNFDKSKQKRSHSPTSEALIFSLNTLGEQPRNQKSEFTLPKVIYNQDKGQVLGKKPCARDGHSALLHEENMIILGGDRHMVSFNDAYIFKLNKGVESLPHYE